MNQESAPFSSSEETWRIFRIMSEFVEGFETLSRSGPCITVFGSARTKESDDFYRLARETARLAAQKGYGIITGGGPGIMEAANRGARRAGAKTIGMNISIPEPQSANPYISPELSFLFHYFFMRKFWLISPAKAIIAFPGGFGTLDEVFETLTLIQTGKIRRRDMTVVLYGEEYWRRIVRFETLLEEGAVAPRDLEIFSFASTPREAFRLLKRRLSATLPKR